MYHYKNVPISNGFISKNLNPTLDTIPLVNIVVVHPKHKSNHSSIEN